MDAITCFNTLLAHAKTGDILIESVNHVDTHYNIVLVSLSAKTIEIEAVNDDTLFCSIEPHSFESLIQNGSSFYLDADINTKSIAATA